MKVAIIDLGTNTFNLLIVSISVGAPSSILHQEKQAVKLGEKTINTDLISQDACGRAVTVLNKYKKIIEQLDVDLVRAYATSAVRTARNSADFLKLIKEQCSLNVNVLSGEREAELIYYGVSRAIELDDTKPQLIMDIGGGSNEFIIATASDLLWSASFPLGMARMIDRFNPENPISDQCIQAATAYFDQQLAPLWQACKEFPVDHLIGSSGSFDTFRSLLANANLIPKNNETSCAIPFDLYKNLHNQLIKSTKEERECWPGMDVDRIEMIVMASLFTQLVVSKLGIQYLSQSDYALKEGALLMEGF